MRVERWGPDGAKLQSFDEVLNGARQRAQSRQNLDLDRIKDLGIKWVDGGDSHPHLPNGGYVTQNLRDRKGVPMVLAKSAIRGAAKLMGVKTNFFNGFEDADAFPKMLVNKLDNPNRKGEHTYKVRTGIGENGLQEVVSAILPGDYRIRDANEQLAHFAGLVIENLGPIRGVSVQESKDPGDAIAYRMIVGHNIMPSQDDMKGQFMAFCFRMSENGLFPDETTLGLWRMICSNGAMGFDGANIAQWTHRTELTDYLNKAGKSIHAAGTISQAWSKVFEQMAATNLDRPATDLLFDMKAHRLITETHHDMAEVHAKSGLEPDRTQFDLFNLLTRGAQDLPDIRQRQAAERKTLQVFTEGQGIVGAMEKARIKVARRNPDSPFAAGIINVPGHERPGPAFATQLREALNN